MQHPRRNIRFGLKSTENQNMNIQRFWSLIWGSHNREIYISLWNSELNQLATFFLTIKQYELLCIICLLLFSYYPVRIIVKFKNAIHFIIKYNRKSFGQRKNFYVFFQPSKSVKIFRAYKRSWESVWIARSVLEFGHSSIAVIWIFQITLYWRNT